LDWVLVWNRRHLEDVLTEYIRHYNNARPHRGIGLKAPVPRSGIDTREYRTDPAYPTADVLGGLIHEYRHAA
jgi:hypothetical protein